MKFLVTCLVGISMLVCVRSWHFHHLNDLGCWTDSVDRAVATIEGTFPATGSYGARANAIQACAEAASSLGYELICVQNGGWCASALNARDTYQSQGISTNCASDGEGGPYANHCYEVDVVWEVEFHPIACSLDTSDRDIATLEGTSGQLNGGYQQRSDAVRKCARLAASMDIGPYFAIQNGGWCAAGSSYGSYGDSTACGDLGKGGPFANAVYEINYVNKLHLEPKGCWKDTADRAIRPAENNHPDLTGPYQQREDAVGKCARYTHSLRLSYFAMQNGGWCATSDTASQTYDEYGTQTTCQNDGKGGPWGNAVYRILP